MPPILNVTLRRPGYLAKVTFISSADYLPYLTSKQVLRRFRAHFMPAGLGQMLSLSKGLPPICNQLFIRSQTLSALRYVDLKARYMCGITWSA